MSKRSLMLVAALAAGTACAHAPTPPPPPPAPPPVSAVGTFDFTTALEGTVVNGTIIIARTDAGYGGTVTTSVTEPIPVRTVVVEGQKLTLTADTPDGPLVFTMDFKGDEFTGGWTLSTMAGTHSGKRRKL
ncbi:MAG: hypothetical protein FIB01_06705 [Gemmatimonadetes bacterium]|nr:hypothetical protein [Gemmatimonadota bacterium]